MQDNIFFIKTFYKRKLSSLTQEKGIVWCFMVFRLIFLAYKRIIGSEVGRNELLDAISGLL